MLGALLAWNPSQWMDPLCDHIPDIGMCDCFTAADDSAKHQCYGDQWIWRTQFSVLIVFVFLLVLCISGCSRHAAKDCPAGKFLALVLLIVVFFFVPNSLFSVFGSVAGFLSALYLVAQTILLMDFAYSWNEQWHTNAQGAQRQLNNQGYRMWLIGIVVAAALWFILSLVEVSLLCITFSTGGSRTLTLVAYSVGLALLVISITEWCKHGALLTSCLVLAYMMWLTYEALAMLPLENGGNANLLPRWVGLIVCAVSLTAFAHSTSFGKREEVVPGTQGALAEQGAVGAAAMEAHDESEDVPEGLDTSDFTVQCCVHATAAVYIASALAPSQSMVTFGARTAAVGLSLLLYGWTLVAPMILKNRAF